MRYDFNNSNIITGYIKELLHDFNLPVYTVARDDKPLYEGKIYLDQTRFIQIKNGDKKEIGRYSFGSHYDNFTRNLKINSSIYDLNTHYYLGEYLRFLRDYLGLNLMPLYNCFGYEAPIGLNYIVTVPYEHYNEDTQLMEEKEYKFYIDIGDDKYYYYIVPIKFDETYTIAMDCPAKVEVASIIYTGDKVLNISRQLTRNTYKAYPGISLLNPVKYKANISADTEYIVDLDLPTIKAPLYYYEKYLRLLIKVPKSVSTSITVLEGDFNNYQILGHKCTVYKSDTVTRPIYPTCLSLLKVNDGISYPFATRLVEYLLNNSITNVSEIKNNISRLQDMLYKDTPFKGYRDIWTDQIRLDIYNKQNEKVKNINNKMLRMLKLTNLGSEGYQYIDPTEWPYSELEPNLDFYLGYTLNDTTYDLLAYGDKDVEYKLESE